MNAFRLAHPAALLLLALPPLALIWIARSKRRLLPAVQFSDARLLRDLPAGWRVRLRHLPDALRLLVWLLLALALARPQSGRSQEIIRGQGIGIVLALDISGSMAALDFAPQNRLEAAKAVISRFVNEREFDRIGLVVFAQDAFQQTPLTLDYAALLRGLEELRLAGELGLPDGTAIGLGLASAANMLRAGETASRVIILLTDGANNAGGISPTTAADAAAAFGIRVYTIGMGKAGLVPVPDSAGNTQMIESDLDETTLQGIAAATGGQYFRAEDLDNLQRVYDQINTLERSDVTRQVFVDWQDQAWLLLWPALLLLALERGLRQTVFRTIP